MPSFGRTTCLPGLKRPEVPAMFRTHLLRGSLALSLAGLLTGCGGGGIFFGDPETVTNEPATLDGYVTSAGAVVAASATNGIGVGDNNANEGRRGFVRFTLAGIPSDAEIVSAQIQLFQGGLDGNPYATLGTIRVDHMDLGAGLDAGDYNAAALVSDVGTLSINWNIEAKTLDVTTSIAADLMAGRPTADFRLRFHLGNTDADGLNDTARFQDMELNLPAGTAPLLTVVWK
jgi:hypothetical protein